MERPNGNGNENGLRSHSCPFHSVDGMVTDVANRYLIVLGQGS